MVRDSLLIVLVFCTFTVAAQHPVPYKTNNSNDVYGSFEKNQIANLYESYSLNIDPAYELINGREYFPYYYRSEFKPILFIDKKHLSSIILKGKKYDDIALNYDTYTDQVIYADSTLSFQSRMIEVALNKDNIDYFDLCYPDDTLSFRYFRKNTMSGFDLQDGFYEVAFDNVSKYLIKHRSSTYISNNVIEYNYIPVNYVNVGKGFSKITTTRQLIKLFGERSEEVRKFIKKSGINIHKADKKQIVCVLKFYDNLNIHIK